MDPGGMTEPPPDEAALEPGRPHKTGLLPGI